MRWYESRGWVLIRGSLQMGKRYKKLLQELTSLDQELNRSNDEDQDEGDFVPDSYDAPPSPPVGLKVIAATSKVHPSQATAGFEDRVWEEDVHIVKKERERNTNRTLVVLAGDALSLSV